MRIENQPYGRLYEIIYDNAFTTHPYKHPTIGSMADLEAASIEDVREFHRHFYVPRTRCYRGRRLRHGAGARSSSPVLRPRAEGRQPVPRDIPQEPRRPRSGASWWRSVAAAGGGRGYHVTYDGHPDSYPLHITSKILSDGQSARIPRELVYNKRLALTAFGSGNITEHRTCSTRWRSCSRADAEAPSRRSSPSSRS
jgi:hypothetical protein